jgi:hypothetical protein
MIKETTKIDEYIKSLYIKYAGKYDIQPKMQCDVLEQLLKDTDSGDILEIGAHEGNHTVLFLELAKKYNRKVFVIDPYNGQQQGNDSVYEVFLSRTKDYDNLVHLRYPSQSDEAEELIRSNSFIYAFIDGLHTIPALEQDINISMYSMMDNSVMCIDDSEISGWEELWERCKIRYDSLSIVDKPVEISDDHVSANVDERLRIAENHNYGIYNPGHKKMEFLIKK